MRVSTGLTVNNARKEEGGLHFWILLIAGEEVGVTAL